MGEKVLQNLWKNYQHETSKCFNFNVKNPYTVEKKNRNRCATSEAIDYFLNNVFTEIMCHHIIALTQMRLTLKFVIRDKL